MTNILTFIGWIGLVLFCCWYSIFVFFITVPTFGEALFSGKLWQKACGLIMWATLIYLWFFTFSLVSFNFSVRVA